MKIRTYIRALFVLLAVITNIHSFPLQQTDFQSTVGYKIGTISGYSIIKSYNASKLYEVVCPQIKDARPVKIAELKGSHYQVGYAYAALLGPQIVDTYHTFMGAEFPQKWQQFLLQSFLDWQYDSYVSDNIPHQFKQELRGIQEGGVKQHKILNLRTIFQQTLVISSYPGNFTSDIAYTLLDQFFRDQLHINNQKILNLLQDKFFEVAKLIKDFFNRKMIHCSFFALWGNRTDGHKLLTMRNLDWEANTGMNKNKILFVWKIDGTIPHVTPGFPCILGALTGISKAGITVHEAGLDSLRATELGFQWTLRLRFIMMYAHNLEEAKKIWTQTTNTLGMNHMVASANDLVTNKPAFAVETMRNYTAWFYDNDQRQKGTIFVDPDTKQKFEAGFAMEQALFRTNHAYDPFINKYRTRLPGVTTSTTRRYMVMKDGIKYYEDQNIKIGDEEAINITAITAHKGGKNAYRCPGDGDQGTNVISAVFAPAQQIMYIAFEYGADTTYRTACCGVYMKIDMNDWFK